MQEPLEVPGRMGGKVLKVIKVEKVLLVQEAIKGPLVLQAQ